MTEEIIIDGVNVAGCIYYKQECIANCGMFALGDFKCEGQICLYKQLKRLEQENKELKENQCHFSTCEHIDAEIARYEKLSESFLNYRSALEEILESAKFAQCLPCGSGNLEDCLNCDDDITNNGQFCMEKRIHEIKKKCVEVLGE